MEDEKQEIIEFMHGQIQQVRDVKGSALAKIAAAELDLLVERYRTGEISMEEMVSRYEKVATEVVTLAVKGVIV